MTTISQPGRRYSGSFTNGDTLVFDGELLSRRDKKKLEKKKKRPPRPTVLGVIGELFITVGLIVLMFVGWELYYTNIIAAREQAVFQENVLDQFSANQTPGFTGDGADPAVPADVDPSNGSWGILYIPKFGDDFSVPMVDGTDDSVINAGVVGRYDNSTRPGEPGNLAVAGHRQTYGAILWHLDRVGPGDTMYVQTANGFWKYEIQKNHIIAPNQVEVLDPNPLEPGTPSDEQFLTVTTCHPPYTTLERMITHGVKTDFTPISEGPPAEIAKAAAPNMPNDENTAGREFLQENFPWTFEDFLNG